jgi:hypothetical protein
MTTRLYTVKNKLTGTVVLVEAASEAQAVRIISADTFDVHVSKATEVGKLIWGGAKMISLNDPAT